MKMLILATVMGASVTLNGAVATAQTSSPQDTTTHRVSNQDLDLLRKDLRSQRKQLIAANLILTDAEATKFWPVYDQYTTELIAINDKKFAAIQKYADNYGKMTDEQSLSYIRQWLDFDIAAAQLRQKYVPIVSKVLPGVKTATFFQLDRRIAMLLEVQVSSHIPLVQSQGQ
jgi:hypothetical protein